MSNDRKTPSPNAEQLLFTQVNGICPICAEPLIYTKGTPSGYFKNYQLAHIYPLNPLVEEKTLLKDEPRLSDDVNSIDNFIPLCLRCHNRFDNPRTVEEYRELYKLKKKLIDEENVKNIFSQYTIADEIQTVISALAQIDLGSANDKLVFTALEIEKKLKKDFSPVTKRYIVADVIDYFLLIRHLFSNIERDTPGKFDTIAANIHAFYLNLKITVTTQEEIYNGMVYWLYTKTKKCSLDACKVVVAFFIQICEVFEYVTE